MKLGCAEEFKKVIYLKIQEFLKVLVLAHTLVLLTFAIDKKKDFLEHTQLSSLNYNSLIIKDVSINSLKN